MINDRVAPAQKIAFPSTAGYDMHGPHLSYPYDGHYNTKHKDSGHKNNVAVSALTLLAFLFFLHILQTCLHEHDVATNQVVVMTAGSAREEEKTEVDRKGVEKREESVVYEEVPFVEVKHTQTGHKAA